MFKIFLAGLLLTIMIGSLILALKESDGKSRIRVMKWFGFTSLCAFIAVIILLLVTIFF